MGQRRDLAVRAPTRPQALLVRVVLALLAVQAAQASSANTLPVEIEQVAAIAEELRAGIDRTTFDSEALAFKLAPEEPEAIVTWVRDAIAFEPYAGLLRGPNGTLMSGAGNALDQAVLLAKVLGDAGFDTRIGLGTLETPDVEWLLREFRERPRGPDLIAEPVDATRLLAAIDRLAAVTMPDALPGDGSPVADDKADRATASAARDDIVSALQRSGVGYGQQSLEPILRLETSEYAWVEYRLTSGEPWREAHPLFPPGRSPQELAARDYLIDSVPEVLQHRLRVEVLIEVRFGEELREQAVMSPWERPTANLVGITLGYANMPLGIIDWNSIANMTERIETIPMFAPVFGRGLAEGGKVFDAGGNTIALEAAASAAVGMFQELGKKSSRAAAAVAALGSTSATPAREMATELTGQRIVFTLIAPGGRETSHSRMLLDRIGAANRVAGRLDIAEPSFAPLLAMQSIAVAVGRYPRPYLTDRVLAEVIAWRPGLSALWQQVEAGDGEAALQWPGELSILDPLVTFVDFDAFEAGAGPSYRPAPALVLRQDGVRIAGGEIRSYALFDIAANPRRTLIPASLERDVAGTILQGAWETTVEGRGARTAFASGQRSFGAGKMLAAAASEGIDTTVLTPADQSALTALGLPVGAREEIGRELRRGQLVIVPQRLPAGFERIAWWRVDPATGVTLGVTDDGRGAAYSEWVVVSIVAGGIAGAFLGIRAIHCKGVVDEMVRRAGRDDNRADWTFKCVWGEAIYNLRNWLRTAE